MLNSMRKHGTTLAVFAAVTTGLTAVVYALTKTTIAHQAALQQKALLDQVVPPENYDNIMQNECLLVSDPALGDGAPHRLYLARKNGQPTAAALETTAPDGYSGAIKLLVGADFNGTVLGTRVIEHHETPGLGDKIELRISDWISFFSGKKIEGPDDKRWAVKKTAACSTNSPARPSPRGRWSMRCAARRCIWKRCRLNLKAYLRVEPPNE